MYDEQWGHVNIGRSAVDREFLYIGEENDREERKMIERRGKTRRPLPSPPSPPVLSPSPPGGRRAPEPPRKPPRTLENLREPVPISVLPI